MRRVFGFLMVAMLAMRAHGASLSVASSNATLVTATSAKLNAAVLDVGAGNPNGWFCWGTSTNGGTNLSSWAGVTNLGECVAGRVSTNVTGLASNTTYYFRLYVSNDTETAWASIASFKTLKTVSGTDVEFDPDETEPEVPVVSAAINSANATLVTGGSAKLNAYLIDDWATNPVCWFYYGTTDGGTNAGTWQYSTNAGNQTTGAVSAVVTGLTVSTVYYFRMSATNGTNVAWGDVETFTTLPVMDGSVAVVAVELGISNATLVTASSATLNGAVVNPGDTNPVCTYYYGKADAGSVFTNWGYSTNVGQQGLGRVAAAITGLDSNTVYYYRLYATNYSDTAWSGLSSFRTIPSPVTDLGGIISNATHLVGVPGDRFIQKGGLSGQMWLSDGTGEGSWGTPAGGGDVIQSELVAATNGVYQRASNDWAAADAAVMLLLSNALVSAWRADDAALSNWVSGIVATNVGAGDTNLWAMSNGVWVTFSPGAGSGIESDPWFTNWATTSGWATVAITNDLYPRNNPSNWVTETITNGLASTNWVAAQGYVTEAITNGLYPASNPSNWVTQAVTNGLPTMAITNGLWGYEAGTSWVDTTYYPRNNPSNWVTASVTNGLASEGWVAAQGYVTEAITNGLWRLEDGTNWVANIWWPTIDASAITAEMIGQWDDAYGWGDHAGLYDLVGSAAAASNGVIAQLVSSNWVTQTVTNGLPTTADITAATSGVYSAAASGWAAADTAVSNYALSRTPCVNSGFTVIRTNSQTIARETWTTVRWNSNQFDDANAFNLTSNCYVVPATGFYSFDASCLFVGLTEGVRVTACLTVVSADRSATNSYNGPAQRNTSFGWPAGFVSKAMKMTANEQVYVQVWHSYSTNASLYGSVGGDSTYFYGYRLY